MSPWRRAAATAGAALVPAFHSKASCVQAWDSNWDGRGAAARPSSSAAESAAAASAAAAAAGSNLAAQQSDGKQRRGPTKHIILIRHGQYVKRTLLLLLPLLLLPTQLRCERPSFCQPTHPRTSLRYEHFGDNSLTQLGREQAELCGFRLKELTKGTLRPHAGGGTVKVEWDSVISSDMPRAKQTAEIIGKVLGVPLAPPDPMLAEGCPCIPEPASSAYTPSEHTVWKDGSRIEAAFRKYVHRAKPPKGDDEHPEDEWHLVVCHGNVIRYFLCRALQLPPEAWLRFATFNTGITHLRVGPSGNVSLQGFGDVGHLPVEMVTYS